MEGKTVTFTEEKPNKQFLKWPVFTRVQKEHHKNEAVRVEWADIVPRYEKWRS